MNLKSVNSLKTHPNYAKILIRLKMPWPYSMSSEQVSGLKLNQSKTMALWLGPWRFSDSKPLGLKWTKDPVRTLFLFVSYDEKGNCKKILSKKSRK